MDLLSGHALNVPLVDLTAPDIHSTCCDSQKEKRNTKGSQSKGTEKKERKHVQPRK